MVAVASQRQGAAATDAGSNRRFDILCQRPVPVLDGGGVSAQLVQRLGAVEVGVGGWSGWTSRTRARFCSKSVFRSTRRLSPESQSRPRLGQFRTRSTRFVLSQPSERLIVGTAAGVENLPNESALHGHVARLGVRAERVGGQVRLLADDAPPVIHDRLALDLLS